MRRLIPVLAVLVLAGCGGGDDEASVESQRAEVAPWALRNDIDVDEIADQMTEVGTAGDLYAMGFECVELQELAEGVLAVDEPYPVVEQADLWTETYELLRDSSNNCVQAVLDTDPDRLSLAVDQIRQVNDNMALLTAGLGEDV